MLAPTQQELPRIGDFVAAKYRIEDVLGRGGMGAVFRVTHAVTGKSFAVKWLLPQFHQSQEVAQRFIREAQVAGRVDHPNVVEVYDIGEDRGSMYMVMELLQGESLAQHLVRLGRLPASQACQLLIPVTRGLAAAHRSGVIHRDLKPDNIFLSVSTIGEPRPKVLDFGISKMSALTVDANPALTREGVVMGTPNYMAPEQLRSHSVDERCDVYALGVILYQMLSGQLPFVGDNFPDLMLKIISDTPIPLAKLAPETPRELLSIIECAMSRSPAERFDSVADLGRALEPFGLGALFDVEQTLSARPPSSILPGPATPVATESRFPDTVAQPVNVLERARRMLVPLSVSAVSALLFSWVYVSVDAQRSAPPTAAADAAPQIEPAPDGMRSTGSELAAESHEQAPAAQLADGDALPVPHVTSLADEQLAAAAQVLATLPDTPTLIGGVPAPEPATIEPAPATVPDDAPDGRIGFTSVAAAQPAPALTQTGAINAPAPVPPPGAARPNGVPAETDPASVKPKKTASKKAQSKAYDSPEIRINDFFK